MLTLLINGSGWELGLVKGPGPESQGAVLLTHGPFWMLSGTALLQILLEGDGSFSSDVSNCRTSPYSCLHVGQIFTLRGLMVRLLSASVGAGAGPG